MANVQVQAMRLVQPKKKAFNSGAVCVYRRFGWSSAFTVSVIGFQPVAKVFEGLRGESPSVVLAVGLPPIQEWFHSVGVVFNGDL